MAIKEKSLNRTGRYRLSIRACDAFRDTHHDPEEPEKFNKHPRPLLFGGRGRLHFFSRAGKGHRRRARISQFLPLRRYSRACRKILRRSALLDQRRFLFFQLLPPLVLPASLFSPLQKQSRHPFALSGRASELVSFSHSFFFFFFFFVRTPRRPRTIVAGRAGGANPRQRRRRRDERAKRDAGTPANTCGARAERRADRGTC